jgi:4-hydroxythreonine-4-phosphate dehydrogenase
MGEPGGIGPEVIIKAMMSSGIRDHCNPVIIGDIGVMKEAVKMAGLPLKVMPVTRISNSLPGKGGIGVYEVGTSGTFDKGKPSGHAGRVVVEYVKKAVELALKKEVQAVVTSPVSKESLKMAGHPWPGHTELLAELTGTKSFAMMFVSSELKVVLSTIHIPLRDVPLKIDERRVLRIISLAARGAGMLGIRNPRIAVAGLNPHAGESGHLGREEERVIAPAVKKAQHEGITVTGPHPPDVVFYRALKGDFDIVVCMYHDQGLIPFKMLAFDSGVNVTVGLPIIRTSPDHGTAFDIAWRNMANPSSMIEAIKLATKLKIR